MTPVLEIFNSIWVYFMTQLDQIDSPFQQKNCFVSIKFS